MTSNNVKKIKKEEIVACAIAFLSFSCLSKLISRVTFLHHLREKKVTKKLHCRLSAVKSYTVLHCNTAQHTLLCLEERLLGYVLMPFPSSHFVLLFQIPREAKSSERSHTKRIVTFIWRKLHLCHY